MQRADKREPVTMQSCVHSHVTSEGQHVNIWARRRAFIHPQTLTRTSQPIPEDSTKLYIYAIRSATMVDYDRTHASHLHY